MQAIQDCEKPVIVALNGTAAGGGAMLALAADLVIAADNAKLIQVFVRRGLIPDGGVAYLLPRARRLHKAKELIFFGDDLSAADAERLGIVNKVVPAAELQATAKEWAERLASGPDQGDRLVEEAAARRVGARRAATCSKKRRCSSSSTPSTAGLGRRRRRRSASAARRSGRAGSAPMPDAHQGQDRGRRDRADRVRQGPPRHRALARVPGDRARARRRGHRAGGGRRARVVHDGAEPRGRRRPQRSGSATSRSSRRSASAAAPAAASSGRPRWRSRPGSATVAVAWRARKRADRGEPAVGAGRRRGSPTASQWTRPFGILRPVDEIAMLTRRYMHEYGGTRDHLANVALAFRKHASAQPGRDDGPQADDARATT